MLKAIVIITAILIGIVNVSAQSGGSRRLVRVQLKRPAVVRVGPSTTYLKEGLTTDEVVGLLGEPTSVTEREDNGRVVKTYEFARDGNRVLVAEFVNDALTISRVETRGDVEQGR